MRAQPFRWIPRGEPFQHQETVPQGSFPPILAHLVRQRGLPDGMNLEAYLHPRLKDLADPFLIPDMRAAVERILVAIDQRQQVCVYGDYDVDGVASIALMRRILLAYGLIAFLVGVQWLQRRGSVRARWAAAPAPVRWGLYYALMLGILVLGVFGQTQFIYFQF